MFSRGTLSATIQYVCPKYMPYGFYQGLWKFYLYGNWVNFVKNMEFILIIYGKNMNKKHGAKKLAMSTKWMQDIFSPMFFLCPQGEHLQYFWEKENMSGFVCKYFTTTCFPFSWQNCVQL